MLILVFIIGLIVGSFLNVLIDRLPKGESVIFGRSYCDKCKRQLEAIDLIPVLSFIIFGAKCRRCKKSISFYYPLIEIITAVIFLFIWIYSSPIIPDVNNLVKTLILISNFGIMSVLIVIFFADLKYRIIPDEMILGLFIFSLPIVVSSQLLPQRIIAAGLLFGILHLLYSLTKGRGIGYGDVKYAGAMGFMLGTLSSLAALYIAFVTGGIFGLILILFGKKGLKSKIAFGPFLVTGTVIMLFWQEAVFDIIVKLFGINL